jgi:hypothetical protein
VFKQELQCIRLQNQEVKKKPEKDNKSLGPATDFGKESDGFTAEF